MDKLIISFVILNYMTADETIRLAKHLSRFSSVDNIIVVDNDSPDGSFEQLRTIQNKKITVVKTDSNKGYSYGNNFGAKICERQNTTIMFIANPDIWIDEENLNKIIKQFQKTDFSILSGVQYEIDGSIGEEPVQTLPTYKDDLQNCFFIGRKINDSKPEKKIDYSIPVQEMTMFRGSFFGIRLHQFFDVGGFDEGLFLYCEENILSKKLIDSGLKIGLVTSARYDHLHANSISKVYKKRATKIKLMYKSKLYYQRKYNRINKIEALILIISMCISLAEFYIDDVIHSKGINNNK